MSRRFVNSYLPTADGSMREYVVPTSCLLGMSLNQTRRAQEGRP